MSFFATLLMDADINPYEEIKSMLDPGHYELPTGKHTIDKNGTKITYGPVLSFDLVVTEQYAEMTFASPRPQANVGCHTWATVYALSFTSNGDTFARGSYMGAAFRKKLIATDA